MKTITAKIDIECADNQHLEISSLLKTILHTLDIAIESKDGLNNFEFYIAGAHPASRTDTNPAIHPLKKTLGL